MFGDLFNGLFGYSKDQTKWEQLPDARDEAIRQSQMGKASYYQHILEQQQATMNRGMMNRGMMSQSMASNSGLSSSVKIITRGEYAELTSLSNWCQSVHPEVYEEWRAMQDLKKASEDESP